jgi:hypothetical protein
MSCLYLVVTILAGLPGPSVAVLCIGPDGHFSVEPGVGRCADKLPSAAAGSDVEGRLGAEGCGPCVDLPMGAANLGARRQSAGMHSVDCSAAAFMASSTQLMNTVGPNTSISGTASPTFSAFPPSRTTILRN